MNQWWTTETGENHLIAFSYREGFHHIEGIAWAALGMIEYFEQSNAPCKCGWAEGMDLSQARLAARSLRRIIPPSPFDQIVGETDAEVRVQLGKLVYG